MSDSRIRTVAIIGAGVQGVQIAFRSAVYGKEVAVFDISPDMLKSADARVKGWLEEYVGAGRLNGVESEKAYGRIRYFTSMEQALEGVDLAIEVVPEKLELKKEVWAQIDRIAAPEMLLTTNSSSLKSSSIYTDVARKDRTFNLNFMTPVKDDLVEVMWNDKTSEETKALAMSFLNDLKLVPIVTKKEIKGFSHNRVWRAIKKETLKLWSQGYCDYEDLDRAFMLEFSTTFGPFGLMDIVGLDVIRDIENSYFNESGDLTDQPPQELIEFIEAGKLGVKSGEGFYKYPNPAYHSRDWLYKSSGPLDIVQNIE